MKCSVCNAALSDETKFCPYCGTPVIRPSGRNTSAKLLKLAESYTGNLAAAREIAAGRHTVQDVRQASIAWIKSRNGDLFKNIPAPSAEGEELRDLENLETELIPLSYEERIIVLMRAEENMTDAAIAAETGITMEQVRSLLQSAYIKNYPAGKARAGDRSIPAQQISEPAKDNGKIGFLRKAGLIIAAVLFIVLSFVLVFRRSGATAYRLGVEALEQGDYDTAIPKLKQAVRFGVNGDETIMVLADAMAETGEYADALIRYEDYYGKHPDDSAAAGIIRCCQELADQSLAMGNTKAASDWLRNAYTLTNDQGAYIRMQAIAADGTYTDEDGRTWDVYGHLQRAVCRDMDQNDVYELEFIYDEDGHWKTIKASVDGVKKKNVYGTFDYSNDAAYTVAFVKDGPLPEYEVLRIVSDEQGQTVLSRKANDNAVENCSYTYAYNEEGVLTESRIRDKDTGEMTYVTFEYDDSGKLSRKEEASSDALRVTTYDYDESGRLSSSQTRENVIDKALTVTYAYDENGRLVRVIEERSEKEAAGIPGGTYREISYEWHAGQIVSASIRNRNGRVIGQGIYVPDNGMLYMYDRK